MSRHLIVAAIFVDTDDITRTARELGRALAPLKAKDTRGDLVAHDPTGAAGVGVDLHHLGLTRAAESWMDLRKEQHDRETPDR